MNNIFFINKKCVYCDACLKCCPTHSIIKNINNIYSIIDSGCIGCFACFNICPVKAIEFYKIKNNLKINRHVLKDKIFIKKFLFNNCNKVNK